MLEEKTCQSVLYYVASLWGYAVRLNEVDALTDETLKTHEMSAPR